MQYSYLGSGQESGRSSVGQALGQTYSPLENVQKMSQEFVSQGLSNAGANYRAQLGEQGANYRAELGEQSADRRYKMTRRDELNEKKATQNATKQQQIAYLGEMLAEQEMLIDAASQSGDPEQERRIPELQKNMSRVRRLLSLNPSTETLAGLLERNTERASMEAETAGARGGLRAPQGGGAKEPNKAKDGSASTEKKKDGTRSLPSGRQTISLD
jgi:hypothetical protein